MNDSRRLQDLYLEWKDRDRSHNQMVAAKVMGLTQSAVSQYIVGRIALNLSAASKFATLFGCNLEDISPELAEELKGIVKSLDKEGTKSNWIPIKQIAVLKGKDALDLVPVAEDNLRVRALKWVSNDEQYAIQIKGDDLSPVIKNGWFVVVDEGMPNRHGEYMLLLLSDGSYVLKEFLYGIDIDPVVTDSVLGGRRASYEPDRIEKILPIMMILPPSSKHAI